MTVKRVREGDQGGQLIIQDFNFIIFSILYIIFQYNIFKWQGIPPGLFCLVIHIRIQQDIILGLF